MAPRAFFAIATLLSVGLGVHTVSAGPYHTKIIGPSDQPVVINVSENVFLRIRNFTQEAGGAVRGVISVTNNDGQTANVLTASLVDPSTVTVPPETINRVVIAGPAAITINPVTGATLTLTYQKVREGAPAATPVPTAGPTATPTPTPTPTP
jgi:hypothetical protein